MGGYLWQSWEIKELQKLREGVPFEEVAKALFHRTEKSVHLKAFKMGYLSEKHIWTDWEDQVIRENCKDSGGRGLTRGKIRVG